MNLVLNDPVKEVVDVTIFYLVQSVYVFFGQSISRWDILSKISDISEVTLKTLNPTRWAGRITSLLALKCRYFDVIKALTKIILESDKKSAIHEAKSLKEKMESFEFILLLFVMTNILAKINKVSVLLQTKNLDLARAMSELNSLKEELKKYRGEFDNVLQESKQFASKWGAKTSFKRTRRTSSILYSTQKEETPFRINVFNVVIDIAIAQIDLRFEGMKDILVVFEILSPPILLKLTDDGLKEKCEKIHQIYPSEISSSLMVELILLKKNHYAMNLKISHVYVNLRILFF